MVRHSSKTRLQSLIEAGSRVLLEKGYRRTQISDVARTMGVAQGTIYLYVESKEALFDLVIRSSVEAGILDGLELPVRNPRPEETVAFVRETLAREMRIASLDQALAKSRTNDSRRELECIVRELYRKASHYWLALKLLERSALDWPELASLWLGEHRTRLLEGFARYFRLRTSAGQFRNTPDSSASARLVLEMIAAFAIHCRVEPPSTRIDQAAAQEAVVDAILHAFTLAPAKKQRVKRGKPT